MDNYPSLKEMGITRPHQIARYSLHMDGKHRDVLHIYYNREKGSWLAASRKYEFGRSSKNVPGEAPGHEPKEIFEISPFLLKALEELDDLLGAREERRDQISVIKEEIDDLEKTIQTRLEQLRTHLDEL